MQTASMIFEQFVEFMRSMSEYILVYFHIIIVIYYYCYYFTFNKKGTFRRVEDWMKKEFNLKEKLRKTC